MEIKDAVFLTMGQQRPVSSLKREAREMGDSPPTFARYSLEECYLLVYGQWNIVMYVQYTDYWTSEP